MIPVRTIALVLAMTIVPGAAFAQEASLSLSAQGARHFVDRAGSAAPESYAIFPSDESTSMKEARAALMEAPLPLLEQPALLAERPTEHKFFDHQQLFALYVHSGVRVADTIKTCRELAHGGVEVWIPTQSCAGIAAWNAGSVGLALGIGWIFHHYGLHRLERLTPWVGTGASAAGLTKSVFNIR